MKKRYYVAAASLAVVTLIASPVLAKNNGGNNDGNDGNHGWNFGRSFARMIKIGNPVDTSKFLVVGTIVSKTDTTLTISVQKNVNVSNITNNQVTVTTDNNTKLGDGDSDNDDSFTLASLKVGDNVMVVGTISGTTLTATNIRLSTKEVKVQNMTAYGQVMSKTDTSVTIKNNVTGTSQTVTVNASTKVSINGENKTLVDIQVGDRGMIKFTTDATTTTSTAKTITLFR
jgi:hypothetical protein